MTINIFRREDIAPCWLCEGKSHVADRSCPDCEGTGKHAFRLEKLLAAWQNGVKLSDLLPSLKGSYFDLDIVLKTWTQHLTRHGCPWAVTEKEGRSVLWKIDETLRTKAQIDSEREKSGVRWFKEGDNRIYDGKSLD